MLNGNSDYLLLIVCLVGTGLFVVHCMLSGNIDYSLFTDCLMGTVIICCSLYA